jgi:hypothetical protein
MFNREHADHLVFRGDHAAHQITRIGPADFRRRLDAVGKDIHNVRHGVVEQAGDLITAWRAVGSEEASRDVPRDRLWAEQPHAG